MSSLRLFKNKTLEERLEQASVCCDECGERYGIYSVGYSSYWIGLCHICLEEKQVTETRDYGYLLKGRRAMNAKKDESD